MTHCPYCALQCSMSVIDGQVAPGPGGLCQKGWTAGELLRHPGRLTTPLLHGEPVSWDEALDFVAARIRSYEPDEVAVFGGGGLTNEKAYLLGKFARVALRTSQIDYNGRFCMSSAAAAGNKAFGLDRGLPFPLTDLRSADTVLLAGSNPAETMPPFLRHLEGARLIVIDPRRTPTAERATLHLQPAPGTDLALALGLLHTAVIEGVIDKEYISSRTSGFDDAWRIAAQWWPEHTERVTGVSAADQRAAVHMLAGRSYILTGRGTEQHASGTDNVSAWINLALALGLPGRTGSGYGCLTGQGNGQGGREHGQKADQLPGYRKLDDPVARQHIMKIWGVDWLPGVGRSAYELLDADDVKAMLVFGSNPVVSAPRASGIADRLKALDLLVVADFVMSETAAMADVVFPVTQWAEEDGTMTNLEGRIIRRRKALDPPAGVRSDLHLIHGLAARLGCAEKFLTEPKEVFEELRRASAGGPSDYSGVTYERLDSEQLHWPVPSVDHPGTPRLFLDRFAHPDGLAKFIPVDHRGPAEPPDEEFPLQATTGRVLQHYQSGAQTRRIGELMKAVPEMYVEVHPDTASRAGLEPNGLAHVVSRRGRVTATVRCVPSMRVDAVFLPFHFPGEGRANLLTNPALDPTSRMPEFKVCAVRLEQVCDES